MPAQQCRLQPFNRQGLHFVCHLQCLNTLSCLVEMMEVFLRAISSQVGFCERFQASLKDLESRLGTAEAVLAATKEWGCRIEMSGNVLSYLRMNGDLVEPLNDADNLQGACEMSLWIYPCRQQITWKTCAAFPAFTEVHCDKPASGGANC